MEKREANKVLNQRGEVYFTFTLDNPAKIHTLTNIVSISTLDGTRVFAYANRSEFSRFLGLGIPFDVLPEPGLAVNPHMLDETGLDSPLAWDFYPTYTAYEAMMYQFASNYPNLCQIKNIGTLASGRKLLVAKLSANVSVRENEPQFLYVSSIHGNELVGYVLMLRLIDYLLSNYGTSTRITSMLNNCEIWINPLANPDGTFHGGNTTVSGATRYNANSVDLNRNFPDPQNGPHPDGNAWQPETVAFMAFEDSNNFVMSANFHGGAEVVNYPWDTWSQLHADNTWWVNVSREYADTVQAHGPFGYFNDLSNGITNGYAWYEVNGGRQDYTTYFRHGREATIEMASTMMPTASTLPNYWNYHYRSFLNYIEEAFYGIHGTVTDSLTGVPLHAKVFIAGHDFDSSFVYSNLPVGDYHRLIAAGTYSLTFSAPGYHSKTLSVTVTNHLRTNLNVLLSPIIHTYTVSGQVTYNNDASAPLDGLLLTLRSAGGAVVATQNTSLSGTYSFSNVQPGAYTIEVSCSKQWSAVNSIDALVALKQFAGLEQLTGLRLRAADVNSDLTMNSLDAFLIQRRFVGLINNFAAGDWIFDSTDVLVTNADLVLNFKGQVTGDLNGSWTN